MVSAVTKGEALARLPEHERRWVEAFAERVRAALGARARDIRLFGSKARGDWHDESDIDLLVLVQDLDQNITDRIWELAHEISGWLYPVVEDFDSYHAPRSRATGFYQEMRKESVRL